MIDYIFFLTKEDKELIKIIESKIGDLNIDDILYTKDKLKKAISIKYPKNTDELYEDIDNIDFTSEEDFIKIHDSYLNEEKGYRNINVVVKMEDKVVDVGCDQAKLPEHMHTLFEYIKDNKDFEPLVLGPIFHIHTAKIHPFYDGNGRMSRLWMTRILMNKNKIFKYLPIQEKIITNRRRYYTAIWDSEKQKLPEPFINYMLNIIVELIDEIDKDKEERKNNYGKE